MMFFLWLSLLLPFSFAREGGINGGGTDSLPPDFGAAWFLDGTPERHVKVCVSHDPENFPMDAELVKGPFHWAVKTWSDYINHRGVNSEDIEDDEDEEYDPRTMKLVTDFRFVSDCDSADLEISLGGRTPEIQNIKKYMFNPFGFAFRKSYDASKGWGKGILWLRGPDAEKGFLWDKNDLMNLKGLFLHELGHIFGIEHIGGTVMDANFSDDFEANEIERGQWYWKHFTEQMTEIDRTEEIKQQFNFTALNSLPVSSLWMPGSRTERETFRYLTGRDPVGEAKAHFTFKREERTQLITGEYRVWDRNGSYSYPMSFTFSGLNFTLSGRNIFKRYREGKDEEGSTTFQSNSTDVRFISLHGSVMINGVAKPLVLEATSPPMMISAPYPEDQREGGILLKKDPYRLVSYEGEKMHFLYASYGWMKDSPGEDEGRKRTVSPALRTFFSALR